MKRIAVSVLALALGTGLAACGSSDKPGTGQTAQGKGCPPATGKAGSYSGRFEGQVSMDQSEHVLRVTRDGRPVSGAKVCVNTAMVGMRSMHYTASGKELGPGRYRVPIRFGMAGTYRGSLVTGKGGGGASVPLTVKVAAKGKMSHDMKSHGK